MVVSIIFHLEYLFKFLIIRNVFQICQSLNVGWRIPTNSIHKVNGNALSLILIISFLKVEDINDIGIDIVFKHKIHLVIINIFLVNFKRVCYNTPRFSDRHNYGGMTRNRYICKKEENQNGKTI